MNQQTIFPHTKATIFFKAILFATVFKKQVELFSNLPETGHGASLTHIFPTDTADSVCLYKEKDTQNIFKDSKPQNICSISYLS